MSPLPNDGRIARREALVASIVCFLVALLPLSAAVLRPERVFFAVDTASTKLPWSATPQAEGLVEANPALSDQGVCFYPFYRWVSRSWRQGDPPAWCPLIYAGAPGLGNAQSGALDPQVLFLVLLEALGGEDWFHAGFAWAAWLRLGFAGLGAYLLARRLGLLCAPAALAAATFGFSGYLILWLNHPLGHVPPLLPWVLYFLEGLRREAHERPAPGEPPRPSFGSMAKVALALALAVYGGHAETAFYVGAAAGLWALAIAREDLRAGWHGLIALALGTGASALSLLPLTEYLGLSAARAVRSAEAAQLTEQVDLLALGLLLLAAGLVLVSRSKLQVEWRGPLRRRAPAPWFLPALGIALAVVGVALFLARRGLGISAALALVPDLYGAPGPESAYLGEGNYIERASPWIAFCALAFALASFFSPQSALRRRGLVSVLALGSFLLSIELSGLLELFRSVPLVGLGDTVRFAAVGSLALGLLAGDALQSATHPARVVALLVLAPLCLAALVPPTPPSIQAGVPTEPEQDELFGFALTPAREIQGEDSYLEGWWSPGLDVERALARVVRVDEQGNVVEESPLTVELELHDGPSQSALARAAEAVLGAPEGARWFRTPFLLTALLPDGHWRTTVELLREGEPEPIGRRLARISTIRRPLQRTTVSLLALGAGLLALLLIPSAPSPLAWLVVLLVIGQGAWFARGINPSVPREAVFPPTRTEALLAEGLGPHRFFSDPGVLPPDTGLVRGLRAIEGYDAMDVAAFNEYRQVALPPDVNPLLAWSPRGVDLRHPAFRLFGVGMLALREPLEHPDWELVASPLEGDEARRAETWVYRARDPLPRAFCVSDVVSLDELGAVVLEDPGAWDPLTRASIDDPWRPERPFTQATVATPSWTNNSVRVDVALDGDGLLVLTDQAFPGWQAFVDGVRTELFTADMIFRGVALGAGTHTVEMRYRPRSLVIGAWITGLCGMGILALSALAAFRRPVR